MSVENIFNDDNYKLIFLKAILLGINYGKSEKVSYYQDNIQKEIDKIKLNEDDIKISLEKKAKVIHKSQQFQQNINRLEDQKKYILNLIQVLSSKNYAYNYSKINILKNNLIYVNQEISKNKSEITKEMKMSKIN
jgi:hypothetical protein